MAEIIFESNTGVVFEKTVFKNGKCKLVVKGKEGGPSIIAYRYKNVPGLQSPYINWDNLNCCNGWKYDEAYLYTAVQSGKKLYADIAFDIYDDDWIQEQKVKFGRVLPSDTDIETAIKRIQDELPCDCLLLRRSPDRRGYRGGWRYIEICKKGAIADYINLDEVYTAYERLGITIDADARGFIKGHCEIPIESLTDDHSHFSYAHTQFGFQLIVAGLLLGYPVETTASLLERDGLTELTANN